MGETGSSWDCSGEADVPARLSRSSRRRFSFLPVGLSWLDSLYFVVLCVFCFHRSWRGIYLTVVALSDAILNAPPLCQVGDLGPVFICVGVGAKGAAVAVTASRAGAAIVCAMHGENSQELIAEDRVQRGGKRDNNEDRPRHASGERSLYTN